MGPPALGRPAPRRRAPIPRGRRGRQRLPPVCVCVCVWSDCLHMYTSMRMMCIPPAAILTPNTPHHHSVTCPDIYYLDEGLYCPQPAMDPRHPSRPLALRVGVAEVRGREGQARDVPYQNQPKLGMDQIKQLFYMAQELGDTAASPSPAAGTGTGWVLDVCLDYYSTRNPFLDAVAGALHGADGREEARGVVQRYFAGPRFRRRGPQQGVKVEVARVQAEVRIVGGTGRKNKKAAARVLSVDLRAQHKPNTQQLAAFNRLTALLLERAEQAMAAAAATTSAPPPSSLLTATDAAALAALFPPQDGAARIEAFTGLLLKGGSPLVTAVRAMGAHCACLPAHTSGWDVVEGMLTETRALVGRLCRGEQVLDEWGAEPWP